MGSDSLLFVLIGFAAQFVDGALGMAYGVTATTFLLSLGTPPVIASASVHAAEIFTTGVSGLSHIYFRNVDWGVFRKLVLPGMAGAVLGALLLTSVPARPLQTLVSIYLASMGVVIMRKALRKVQLTQLVPQRLSALGLVGGFFDTAGGGGWGPLVTSTILGRGGIPRFTVGSVNLAEFFVALAASTTFLVTIGLGFWRVIAGLVLGGVLAAPFAAYACKKIPARWFMLLIGVLVLVLSLRAIFQVIL
jgi:hypothetical protein